MPNQFNTQLTEVKELKEDFEWYPTTDEILNVFINDLEKRDSVHRFTSFLDIGAGNGKVINRVKKLPNHYINFFAIEKSNRLLELLPEDVYILGVDFNRTTLLDKEISVIFCNPPYSNFEEWTHKILKESWNKSTIYLVIPERWKESKKIKEILDFRKVSFEILGSFDFLSSEDRAARAKVDLIVFKFDKHSYSDDPFVDFFNENFSYPEEKKEEITPDDAPESQIVGGVNFVERLTSIYEARMAQIHRNYSAICSFERDILDEFNITKSGLVESLRLKIKSTKKTFWRKLFDQMREITDRLTVSSRKVILDKLNDQTGIEFNEENIYGVLIWVIKNANKYYDAQFIETYERMVSFANVERYKSNQRVFSEKDFEYSYFERKKVFNTGPIFLKMGHRIVLDSDYMGLRVNWVGRYEASETAYNFIQDLKTTANNLGFSVERDHLEKGDFKDNSPHQFYFKQNSELQLLFEVRLFKNGNMHLRFNPEFIQSMNVMYGKLKGWLKGVKEVKEEIGALEEVSDKVFRLDKPFSLNTFLKLK